MNEFVQKFDRSPEVRLSVCPSVRLSVCPVWLIEHARENNTCSLLCHASLPIICACSNDQSQRTREERTRTRMSDPTLATENELDREDSNRELARLKRAHDGSIDGSNERTDQHVIVALSMKYITLVIIAIHITCSGLMELHVGKYSAWEKHHTVDFIQQV